MASSVAKVSAGLGLTFRRLCGGSLTFSGAIAQDPSQLTPGASRIPFACPDNGGIHT